MVQLNKQYSLLELAEKINATVYQPTAAKAINIQNIATIDTAIKGDITFLINSKYARYLKTCKASAIIISPEYANDKLMPIALISKNPRLSLAKLMQLCLPAKSNHYEIHSSVQIGKDCNIATTVTIGPNCVIGDGVTIKQGVIIEPGVIIGNGCLINDNVQIKANVTLYAGVELGCDTVIHSGTTIGSDGFGYANDEFGNWVKMPHIGKVIIGNNVEIGSNVCIDRGFMENTIIGNGVIIDNLVQIGHNVIIGDNTAIAGCVAIAGSANIGAFCLIGGGSSIAGHITIADKVHITATSGVNRSLLKAGVYSSGLPARENALWKKNVARFQFLDQMAKRIRKLEKIITVAEEQIK